MSKKQKNILVGVIIMIVAMLVYPPFQYTGEGGIVTNMGYDWIYDPPHYLGRYNAQAIVNVPVLLVQWLGVILVGGLVLYLAKDNPESGQKTVPVETRTNENENSNSHAHFTGNPASSDRCRACARPCRCRRMAAFAHYCLDDLWPVAWRWAIVWRNNDAGKDVSELDLCKRMVYLQIRSWVDFPRLCCD